jgi:hypothetical protein
MAWTCGYGRQAIEPLPQVIGQNDGAATAFARDQITVLDRLVNCRSTGARDCARFCDAESKWCIH